MFRVFEQGSRVRIELQLVMFYICFRTNFKIQSSMCMAQIWLCSMAMDAVVQDFAVRAFA